MEKLGDIFSRLLAPGRSRYIPEELPPVCPVCRGFGWVTRTLRIGHPDFGQIYPCRCNLSVLPLGPSFDGFLPNNNYPDLALAFQATRDWCRGDGPAILVLSGGVGVGKTHLARAAYKAILGENPNSKAKWMADGELADAIREAYGTDTWAEWKQEFKTAPWLIIDDLGSTDLSDHMKSRYGEIIDWRWQGAGDKGLRTMYTTNVGPDVLGERVKSRLLDHRRVKAIEIVAPDYRQTR